MSFLNVVILFIFVAVLRIKICLLICHKPLDVGGHGER